MARLTDGHGVDSVMRIMEPEPPAGRLPGSWMDRLQALLEVLLLSGLVSGFVASLPFSAIHGAGTPLTASAKSVSTFLLLEASICLILLLLVLHMNREPLRDLGVRPDRWPSHAVVGLALVPVLFLTNGIVAFSFKLLLPKYFLDRNPLVDVIRTPQDLIIFLCVALFAGGIKEELQRAFILNRFRQHLGGAWLGLVVWSLAFGAGHYIQGPQGVVAASIYGLVFGGVYLARGSLVAPVVAHATYDAVALMGYWFLLGPLK